MSSKLEDFLRMIKPIGEMCGVSEKEMEALRRLLTREASQREPVVELKESLIGRLKNLLIEYDKTLIVRADGLFEINDKPVEPIIKRSGKTLVARYKGIDLFCLEPEAWWYDDFENLDIRQFAEEYNEGREAFFRIWKPFPIEITDEIAKLRPMVKCINNGEMLGIPVKLICVVNNQCFTLREKPVTPEHYYGINWMHIVKCNLATVEDLED